MGRMHVSLDFLSAAGHSLAVSSSHRCAIPERAGYRHQQHYGGQHRHVLFDLFIHIQFFFEYKQLKNLKLKI